MKNLYFTLLVAYVIISINIEYGFAIYVYIVAMIWKRWIVMLKRFFNHVENYTRDIMEENSDNLKMFEIRPGIYSNIDPNKLQDYNVPDFDLNR